MTITPINTSTEPNQKPAHRLSVSAYIEAVESEGARFARTAELSGPDIAIPACPGWSMRDLVRHLGEIHLWAAANIVSPKPRWLHVRQLTDLERYWPDLAAEWPEDEALIAWYRATHANLVHVLRTAPHNVEAFTFLPAPTPLTMWARRQASEIAIHRFDAEAARGGEVSRYDPLFATDMLDELVTGFAPHFRIDAVADRRVLQIVTIDTKEQWWVAIGPHSVSTSQTGDHADLTITGTAADIYLVLWNRAPDSTIHLAGDMRLMDLWRNGCRVVWSGE